MLALWGSGVEVRREEEEEEGKEEGGYRGRSREGRKESTDGRPSGYSGVGRQQSPPVHAMLTSFVIPSAGPGRGYRAKMILRLH